MAFDLELPILPLTINGTDKVSATGTFNLFPEKVGIIVHPPIDIKKYGERNMPELISKTKAVIASARK